jgi:hypothetical protein
MAASNSTNSDKKLGHVEAARLLWKDKWISDFNWLEFNSELGKVFCKVCKEAGGKGAYATSGSVNSKVSTFQDHSNTVEHRKLAWVAQCGSKRMEKHVAQATRTCDEALMTLFKTTYYVGKETIPFSKFPSLCGLLLSVNSTITDKLYHDEKSCAEMLVCISSVIHRKVLDRVRNSQYFGIMVDESADISITGHLVVFATFLEDGVQVCVFLGLLHTPGGRKDAAAIYDLLLTTLNQWGLDLDKLVGFGSNGAAVMTGCCIRIATRLKDNVSPFLLNVHCVVHRTNLASLDAASSGPCKAVSSIIDKLLNDIASHFKRSSKAKSHLLELQKELFDSEKSLKRYQQIRWLSRWQAVTTLYDTLESVLKYFCDADRDDGDGSVVGLIYTRLRTFKHIYCLYFWLIFYIVCQC